MINNQKYVGRDITAVRDDIIRYIKETTDRWSDFTESDLGMVLLS